MNYTINEISKHNKPTDCWLIAHDKVYDITKFIEKHPIGSGPLIKKAGTDCTKDYDFHPKAAKKEWEKCKIGYINNSNESCCLIS